MDFQQLAQALDQIAPGLGTIALQTLPPDAQQALLQIWQQAEQQQPGSGVQAVASALMQLVQQAGAPDQGTPPGGPPPGMPMGGVAAPGAGPGMPPAAPPGPAPDAGNVPPEMLAGQPTQGPPPTGGPPPPGPPGPGQQGPPPPPPITKEQGRQLQPYPKPPAVPKYKLPPLPKTPFAKKKPTLTQVYRDADLGQRMWQQRDDRIKDDLCCWRGEMPVLGLDGAEINRLTGGFAYARSTPFNWVERTAALCAWTNDRVELDVPPRADDDDHRQAAQKYENWLRTGRMDDSDRWFARSEIGDVQPPLELVEAKGMALLGGMGWCWHVDPDDEEQPFRYEYIPINQLYPLEHAITRQFTMTLNQARAVYPEIEDYYQLLDNRVDENQEVRIVGWSDRAGYWHCIAWQEAGAGTAVNGDKQGGWIKEPQAIEYGFPYYNLRIWNSQASGATRDQQDKYREFVGIGILTRVRRSFQIVDMVASAIVGGAIRAVDPPTLQLHQLGTDLDSVPPLDLTAGARNYGFQGDDVKPLIFAMTGNPDGNATVQMLVNEMADIMPPAMSGAQVGYSGFQQMQAAETASATTVGPIIDALEKTYQAIMAQRGTLALRYSKGSNKDLQYFSEYPYRGYQGRDAGRYGTLKPKDLELSGIKADVRYKRLSTAEEAAVANMVIQLSNAHLMSVETALKKLNVREPEREWLNILKDGAMLDPRVLQGLVGAAIMNSGDNLLIQEWVAAGMLQQTAGGSPPAPTGTPSAAGGPAPGIPAGVSTPGSTQPGL